MSNVASLYGGEDPRELPFYTVSEVATYLRIPKSTLSAWCGRKRYRLVDGGYRRMEPLLREDPRTRRLTFHNLVEAFVISSITRTFDIQLPDLRAALARLGGDRPLLDYQFYAADQELFVELADQVLVDVFRSPGQAVIREVMSSSLARIDFDAARQPERFHPWLTSITEAQVVAIDPRRAFGRPTVKGRALKVDVLVDLHRAGESVATIARNYELSEDVIEAVLRWGEHGAVAVA